MGPHPENRKKPAKKPSFSKRSVGSRKRNYGKALPKYLEDFCQNVFAGYNCSESALMVGLKPGSGWYMSKKPEVKQRLIEIAEQYKDDSMERAITERILTTRFLDENLMEVIVNGEGKGKKGRAHALLTGYKSKFLVDPPSPATMIQIKNEQGGGASGGVGGAPKLYQAQRFLKKVEVVEAEANAQLGT